MVENIFFYGGEQESQSIVTRLRWPAVLSAGMSLPALSHSSSSQACSQLDMVPSLTLTDAHLPGSSHLFIYLFICVMFIY